jgi:hypothetical protein
MSLRQAGARLQRGSNGEEMKTCPGHELEAGTDAGFPPPL